MSFDIYFNEEHNILRQKARRFAEEKLAPISEEVDRTDTFPDELRREMAELGFYGLKIPKEYGGQGLDMRSYVVVMEEIGAKSAAAAIYITQANSLSTQPLIRFGTEEQKHKYLPTVCNGEGFIAFGLTEAEAGSDAGGVRTTAVADGDDYIISGTKTFITGAPLAKYAVVYAKTNPQLGSKGITSFMVDLSLPGISFGKGEHKMGQKGMPVSDLFLDDVRVSKDCIVGEVDKGYSIALKTLSVGRIGVAAMSLGMAQEAMKEVVNYTKTTMFNEKPLCRQQYVQFKIAELETKLNAARGLVYDAAYTVDTQERADKESSMAKFCATEYANQIIAEALQLEGEFGCRRGNLMEKLYRDIRVTTIYEGSSQVQQMVIAGVMLR